MPVLKMIVVLFLALWSSALFAESGGSGIRIIKVDERGVPLAIIDNDNNTQLFGNGMFCLPPLELHKTCTDEENPVFWMGRTYIERTTTTVIRAQKNAFVLRIARIIGNSGNAYMHVTYCKFTKSQGTLWCVDAHSPKIKEAALSRGLNLFPNVIMRCVLLQRQDAIFSSRQYLV